MKNYCCSQEISYVDFAKAICQHFLSGVVPGVKTEYSLDKINEQLSRYSGLIQLLPTKPPVWRPLVYLLFAAIFIAAGLFVGNVVKIPNVEIPATVQIFLPYILYPIGIILFLIAILNFSQCGVNFIFKFKGFCKRWGLRLLMLALDLLYIPILTTLVSQATPTNYHCDVGYALYVQHNPADNFNFFVSHPHKCLPCGFTFNEMANQTGIYENWTLDNVSDAWTDAQNWTNISNPYDENIVNSAYYQASCALQCNLGTSLRLADDLSLSFLDDVIKVNGATIAFTVIFIMFGIPYFWYSLISKNRHFVTNLNVYGKTKSDKWNNIVSRLHTTGIFLFAEYKIEYSYWTVLVLFYKFLVMVLSTISINFFSDAVWALPFVYLIMFILVSCNKPHIYNCNNILDGILYFLNMIYSSFPIVTMFGIKIPTMIMTVFSLVVMVFPILSIIVFLIRSVASRQTEDDPTLWHQMTEDELEERRIKIEKRKAAKARKKKREAKAKKRAEKQEKLRQQRLKLEQERQARRQERRQRLIAQGKNPDDYADYSDDYYYSDEYYSDSLPVVAT